MSSTDVKDSNPAENPAHSSSLVITFQLVFNIIMSLKSEILRNTLLLLLENGEDQLSLVAIFLQSIKCLSEQKDEEDKFMERVKAGGVTLGELIEFRESQMKANYCLICLKKINKDNIICQCSSCMFVFHDQCFKKDSTDDKCGACKEDCAHSS